MRAPRENRSHAWCLRGFARDFFIGLGVFLAFLALAVLDTHAAPVLVSQAASPPVQDATPAPDSITTGTLFLHTRTDGRAEGASPAITPAIRLDTNVNITVTGPLARASVTQRFRHAGSSWAEGVFTFPLPETAAVDTLSIRVGERIVKGRITTRDEARRLHETAGGNTHPTALPLHQHRNMFTSTLARIGPGEEITVHIEYQELLRRNGEEYSLRFPLVVAPRHVPRPPVHPVRLGGHAGVSGPLIPANGSGSGGQEVTLQVRLNSGFPLGEVRSPSHEIALRRTGEETALLALTRASVAPDRDFELTWRAKETALPQIAAFHQQQEGNAYVVAMLAPPRLDAAPPAPARDVVFVVDTSQSMNGEPLAQAKESLDLALMRLKPGDRFNIIRYDSTTETLFDQLSPVTPRTLGEASRYVTRLTTRGGTDALPALKAALAVKAPANRERLRQVVFLTDGAVENEAELLSYLATMRERSRLFMVGIGSGPNEILMHRAVEIGRGSYVHVTSAAQLRQRVTRLFARLERPVITDLKVEWAPGLRADTWPNPLPDVYAGEPLMFTAKVSALKGNLKLSGTIGGKPWTQTYELSASKKDESVGKFWARQKIASLEARRYAGQTVSAVDTAIEALAMEHGLVSRMTSIVAVDATPALPGNQPLASDDIAANVPAGWVADRYTRPSPWNAGATRTGETADKGPPLETKLALNGHLPIAGSPPAASTGPSRAWALTVMGLAFAFMTALTLGLWRHLRHAVVPKLRRRV